MIGKIIKLNDYKFEYGKESVYVNVYAGFKDRKTGNKYVIYSYDNKNLRYGTLFIKDNEIVVMKSRSDVVELINNFVMALLNDKYDNDFEIIEIDKVSSIQVIDDTIFEGQIDLDYLFDKVMPKKEVVQDNAPIKKKKGGSITILLLILGVIGASLYFFFNPNLLAGKNVEYSCVKNYRHSELPCYVNEKVDILFNGKGSLSGINITYDYVFSDTEYYKEFRDKSYFYKYFEDGDTYKFDDVSYSFKLFKKVNIDGDFFLAKEEDKLISYYNDNGFVCKKNEVSE